VQTSIPTLNKAPIKEKFEEKLPDLPYIKGLSITIPEPAYKANTNIAYTGYTYTIVVDTITPAGATYTSATTTDTNAGGSGASTTITGSSGYTGTFASPTLTVVAKTITATSAYGAVPIDPNGCFFGGAVAQFDITISGLTNTGTGVPVSVLTGSSFGTATLCAVSSNLNLVGVVTSNQGTSPYQNVVYNANGLKSFYTNLNDAPPYYWCVVNSSTFGGGSYNANYSTAIVSTAGISPAYFTNSCQS
jgi:hypothetical protein